MFKFSIFAVLCFFAVGARAEQQPSRHQVLTDTVDQCYRIPELTDDMMGPYQSGTTPARHGWATTIHYVRVETVRVMVINSEGTVASTTTYQRRVPQENQILSPLYDRIYSSESDIAEFREQVRTRYNRFRAQMRNLLCPA